jgi:hypothetical protein
MATDYKVDVFESDSETLALIFSPMPVLVWHHLVAARDELNEAVGPITERDPGDPIAREVLTKCALGVLASWARKRWLVHPSKEDGSEYMKLYYTS